MNNDRFLPINRIEEFRFEVSEERPEVSIFDKASMRYRLHAALNYCRMPFEERCGYQFSKLHGKRSIVVWNND